MFQRGLAFAILLTLTSSLEETLAQGCSDAGFCTLGSLKHDAAEAEAGDRIQLLLPFGIGDENVRVFTPGVQYDRVFSERWSVQARITANHASGNLGSATGPGDVYLAGIHTRELSQSWKVAWMLAAKIPLDRSDIAEGDMDLPMVYQASLGTFDLIGGVSFIHKTWLISIGWQQPLTGENDNRFLWVHWDSPEAYAYPPTNRFTRKGDVLLRASWSRQLTPGVKVQAGVLNIYHVANDTYVDPAITTGRIEIIGSQGLTVNVTAGAWFTVSPVLRAGVTLGAPVVAREVRPDGLTRRLVVGPELQWTLR